MRPAGPSPTLKPNLNPIGVAKTYVKDSLGKKMVATAMKKISFPHQNPTTSPAPPLAFSHPTPPTPPSSSLPAVSPSLPLSLGHPNPHHPKPTFHPSTLPHSHGKPCMGDPDVDHGFLYDDQGRVDILHSLFFDVTFGNDRTADEYIDRIIYQLTLAIEDQIPPGRWYIINTPPISPDPATSSAATTLRATCLLVASLSLFAIFFR
ncbi:hypothetical protein M5K25_009570 [Dendrobium thyrsiflorum]|uniref:Uncharacterized protein n=1 Tax=Dendrobium thyrsiflorum TaxID=117978 RepID=A0ABD0V666_DENTH